MMNQRRLFIGIILMILLGSLMLYSSVEHDNKDPDINYFRYHFERFQNTTVTFTGVITTINETSQMLTVQLNNPPYPLLDVTIPAQEEKPQAGDMVDILGILDGENHVTAEKILVIPQWKYGLIYLRSLPAIPFALYLFFRTWRFNRKTYRFERRTRDA